MISKDLSRLIQQEEEKHQEQPQMQTLIRRLRDKSFYVWFSSKHSDQSRANNEHTHGDCCFNHILGLPTKNGKQHPLYGYEKMLYKALMEPSYFNSDIKPMARVDSVVERDKRRREAAESTYADFKNKHVWIKKATGLGVTEFMLRFMAWLCLRNDDFRNSQMVIVTGPNQDIAIKLIKRTKALFERHGITFANKETVLELNGCTIEAYPSNI